MIRVKQTAFVILFSVITTLALSQPVQPQDPQGDPDAVPFTGLEYLLVSGGAYGVAQLLRKKKAKNDGV
ncbi:MAG TPA: hypothetical protein VK666_21870 [Chryseolinea sp.]|nr:hypothetical protein [Chryseolinea sp.]